MLSCDGGLAVAKLGSICVVVWRAAVTRERFEAQRVGLEWVVRSHPEGAGFLCLIEGGSPIPDDDMRRASANMISIHRPRLKYVACVMEGDGLRAAAVRLALTAMRQLVTGKVESGFFATTAEAAPHLGLHFPIGSEESFVASVEAIRAQLGS
jgi:hypothetical protein